MNDPSQTYSSQYYVKTTIKDAIHVFLYHPAIVDEQRRVGEIIDTNDRVLNQYAGRFKFEGITYEHPTKGVLTGPIPRLHPSVIPAMQAYLKDVRERVDFEGVLVLGYVTQVLNATVCPADLYELFPEALHEVIKSHIPYNWDCPKPISSERKQKLIADGAESLALMRERMVINLLIG